MRMPTRTNPAHYAAPAQCLQSTEPLGDLTPMYDLVFALQRMQRPILLLLFTILSLRTYMKEPLYSIYCIYGK